MEGQGHRKRLIQLVMGTRSGIYMTMGHFVLAFRVKISANDILKYFYNFSRKIGSDISCKLSPYETICMKCQSLFSGENKKSFFGFSPAAQKVVDILFYDSSIFFQ